MQSTDEGGEPKTGSYMKKNFRRKPSLGNKKHENFSIEIWKKAFSDACGRLCPLRAEGHECGCLPMLPRLVRGCYLICAYREDFSGRCRLFIFLLKIER